MDKILITVTLILGGALIYSGTQRNKSNETISMLRTEIFIQRVQIENLEYQFNMCKRLYIGQ